MKYLNKIIVLLILSNAIETYSQATITINNPNNTVGEITPLLSGCFIEFMQNFINGPYGLWAQEIQNRGFDMEDFYRNQNASYYWNPYNPLKDKKNELKLIAGGYNLNGKYFQRIIKRNDKYNFGVFQQVYVYDSIGDDFYVYLKSDSSNMKVDFMLCDTAENKILFKQSIDGITNNWKKYELKTPPISGTHHANLVISIEKPGVIDIDEASFMPENNVKGIRKEYFNIFKSWKPGIIRYPGGFFADTEENKLLNCIGDIDKRKSPLRQGTLFSQRMDFGLDEFVEFCKSVGAEPHIVVNMVTETPDDAINFMKYCNGDTTTLYGNLRKENGHTEPYGIKYWEVGNEQWSNPLKMSLDYNQFYDAMKGAFPETKIMVCGNLWGGEKYVDTLFHIGKVSADIYSYHTMYPANVETSDFDESERFKSVIGSAYLIGSEVELHNSWLEKYDPERKIKLAVTELFLRFGLPFNLLDSLNSNSSLESGLWMAGCMNSSFRKCNDLQIVEKTFGIGHVKVGYNSSGDRIIYSTPSQLILDFMQNHRGKFLIESLTECDKYSTKEIKGLFTLYDIPLLDVTATSDNYKIYLSVVNRHPEDTIKTKINLPFPKKIPNVLVNELNSKNYYDCSSFDEPDKIKFVESEIVLDEEYSFPPHSYTMLEIPIPINPFPPDSGDLGSVLYIIPNPADKEIIIFNPNRFKAGDEITIISHVGREEISVIQLVETAFLRLSIENLPKGIYFGTINRKMSQYFKFVKL